MAKITGWGGPSAGGDLERAARAEVAEAEAAAEPEAADAAAPRTGDDLPANKDGSPSRSQMTDEEKTILDAGPAAAPEPPAAPEAAAPPPSPKKAASG